MLEDGALVYDTEFFLYTSMKYELNSLEAFWKQPRSSMAPISKPNQPHYVGVLFYSDLLSQRTTSCKKKTQKDDVVLQPNVVERWYMT